MNAEHQTRAGPAGWRRLALAVVEQAMRHHRGQSLQRMRPTAAQAARKEARRFLEGPGLEFWCEMAEINPYAVREAAGISQLETV